MKKFTTLLLAILMVLPALAAKITGGTKLYLTPNSNWTQANARFAAYFFGDGEAWVSMTKVLNEPNDVYEVTAPAGKNFTNVIFCRMNPSATANNWDNKWNQTADLTYDGKNNRYTVKNSTWDKGGGTWSKYTPIVFEIPKELQYLYGNNTVFYVNVYKWAHVYAYAWDVNENNEGNWPGTEMKKVEDVTVNGYDVYMYEYKDASKKIIFNNNNKQTADLDIINGAVYVDNKVGDATIVYPEYIESNQCYGITVGNVEDWQTEGVWYAAKFINKNLGQYTWSVASGVDSKYNGHIFYLAPGNTPKEQPAGPNPDYKYTHIQFFQMPARYVAPADARDIDEINAVISTEEIYYLSGSSTTYNLADKVWMPVGTGVERVEATQGIGYAYGVVSAEGAIEVYNVNGVVVARGNDTIDLRGLGRGVYIVRNGNTVRKVVR